MSYIKFNKSNDKINTVIKPINSNVIEVIGHSCDISGVKMYLDNDVMVGDYSDYKTLYRTIDESTFQYSDNGSVYIEPIIEEPVIIEPTEEELAEIKRQAKLAELNAQISSLKSQLESTDYIIIKLYELSLVGKESDEYNVTDIHVGRDSIRAKINELEMEIDKI